MNLYGQFGLLLGVALLVAGVFVADLEYPVGIEVWVLYLPAIIAPALFNNLRQILIGAAVCSALVVICYFISPLGANPPSWDLLNRAMGLLAIWLSAVMGVVICRRSTLLSRTMGALQAEIAAHGRTEVSLRESEERLRLAMQGGGLGTRDMDPRTGHETWSETQFWILGYEPTPDGKAMSDMWISRTHPDDRRRVREAQDRARSEHSLYHLEYRISRPGLEHPAWVEVFGRFLYDEKGEAVRFVGVCFDVTPRKNLERELLEITSRQQQILGQELHDGVGQELTGLGLMAQTLAQRLPEVTVESRIANRLITGLTQAHQKIREISRGLIPVDVDERGLAAALAELASRTSEQSGVAVTSECPDWVNLPDHATATHLFRIAQEAVTNALRHGRPRNIRLSLLSDPHELRLRVKDDGSGLPENLEKGDGLGMRIMRYRAGLIGGDFQIISAEVGGTIVTCRLSLGKSNDPERS